MKRHTKYIFSLVLTIASVIGMLSFKLYDNKVVFIGFCITAVVFITLGLKFRASTTARFRRMKIIGSIAALLLVLLLSGWLNITDADRNYPFFPRSDLNEIYAKYLESAEDSINAPDYDLSSVSEAEIFYKNMNKCLISGTQYQEGTSEFVLSFDRFNPDFSPNFIEGLSDNGTIVFDADLKDEPATLAFDVFVIKYKGADLFSKNISIQSEFSSEAFALGYMRTVYISPSGELKTYCVPLNQPAETVVETREGLYFLKEIGIFSAYSTESAYQDTEFRYRILRNDSVLYNYVRNSAKR